MILPSDHSDNIIYTVGIQIIKICTVLVRPERKLLFKDNLFKNIPDWCRQVFELTVSKPITCFMA